MSTTRPQFGPAKRTTVSDDIIGQLVTAILRGDLQPGEKLPSERELMEMFAVGRSSIREVLRSLSLVGLTDTRPGEGTFVSQDAWEFVTWPLVWKSLLGRDHAADLIEARRIVEGELTALAASRGGEACTQALAEALSAMEASLGNTELFLDADLDFHIALAVGAGNRLLLQFLVGLRSLLREFISEVLGVSGSESVALEHHRAMLDAVRKGDASEARQAMYIHLDYVGEMLLHRLSESVDGAVTRTEREKTPRLSESTAQD